MKKFFLVTGIVMATVSSASYAQSNIGSNNVSVEGTEKNQSGVSDFTKIQFTSDFPDATSVRFEKTNGYDEVSYSQKGKQMTAYYDFNSQLVGTLSEKSFGNLPEDAQTEILNKYPNYSVVKVLKFSVNSDNESLSDNDTYLTLYGNSFDPGSSYFVELINDGKATVLKVGLSGEVSFFTTIK